MCLLKPWKSAIAHAFVAPASTRRARSLNPLRPARSKFALAQLLSSWPGAADRRKVGLSSSYVKEYMLGINMSNPFSGARGVAETSLRSAGGGLGHLRYIPQHLRLSVSRSPGACSSAGRVRSWERSSQDTSSVWHMPWRAIHLPWRPRSPRALHILASEQRSQLPGQEAGPARHAARTREPRPREQTGTTIGDELGSIATF